MNVWQWPPAASICVDLSRILVCTSIYPRQYFKRVQVPCVFRWNISHNIGANIYTNVKCINVADFSLHFKENWNWITWQQMWFVHRGHRNTFQGRHRCRRPWQWLRVNKHKQLKKKAQNVFLLLCSRVSFIQFQSKSEGPFSDGVLLFHKKEGEHEKPFVISGSDKTLTSQISLSRLSPASWLLLVVFVQERSWSLRRMRPQPGCRRSEGLSPTCRQESDRGGAERQNCGWYKKKNHKTTLLVITSVCTELINWCKV